MQSECIFAMSLKVTIVIVTNIIAITITVLLTVMIELVQLFLWFSRRSFNILCYAVPETVKLVSLLHNSIRY